MLFWSIPEIISVIICNHQWRKFNYLQIEWNTKYLKYDKNMLEILSLLNSFSSGMPVFKSTFFFLPTFWQVKFVHILLFFSIYSQAQYLLTFKVNIVLLKQHINFFFIKTTVALAKIFIVLNLSPFLHIVFFINIIAARKHLK